MQIYLQIFYTVVYCFGIMYVLSYKENNLIGEGGLMHLSKARWTRLHFLNVGIVVIM